MHYFQYFYAVSLFLLFANVLTISFVSCHIIITDDNIVSEENDIIKPPADKSRYRAVTLTNGMKVLMVHQQKRASSCTVSLDVNAGYMNSPKDFQHLAELFAHTFLLAAWIETPEESRLFQFYKSPNGRLICQTTADHTNIDFEVSTGLLPNLLKRLSQQLVSPTFSTGLIERAIQELNDDLDLAFRRDDWPFQPLLRNLSKSSHDFHASFYADRLNKADSINGTRKKLGVSRIRDMLINFHGKYYSTNLITLVIAGNLELNNQMEMVDHYFGSMIRKNRRATSWPIHPIGPEQVGHVYHLVAKSFRIKNHLLLLFPIPDFSSKFKSKPWFYIEHLLTRSGEHSLMNILKGKGLIWGLKAEMQIIAKGFGFFKIVCDLTETGSKNIHEPVSLIMQYLNWLQTRRPEEWIYKEASNKLRWLFMNVAISFDLDLASQSRSLANLYMNDLASALHTVSPKYCLFKNYVMNDYRPNLIKRFMSHLNDENLNIFIWHKNEHFYKLGQETGRIVKLSDKRNNAQILKTTLLSINLGHKNQNVNFSLPQPNPYLSSNFNIVQPEYAENSVIFPQIILESHQTRLWYLKDNTFLLPKVFLCFKLRNLLKYDSLKNYASSLIFEQLVMNRINVKIEATGAVDSNFKANLTPTRFGFSLCFEGMSAKIHDLVKIAFQSMISSTELDQKSFFNLKQSQTKELANKLHIIQLIMESWPWTEDEIKKAMNERTLEHLILDTTLEQIKQFQEEFFSRLNIELFAYGNINKQNAKRVLKDFIGITKQYFPSKPNISTPIVRKSFRSIVLLEGETVLALQHDRKDSTIVSIFQTDPLNISINVQKFSMSDFMHYVMLKIYSENYRDFAGYFTMGSHTDSFEFSLSKRGYTPEQMDNIVENDIKLYKAQLNVLSKGKFKTFKEDFINKFYPKIDSMNSVAEIYWNEIENEEYFFNRTDDIAANLRTISKNNLIAYFKEIFDSDSSKRKKLSIYFYQSNHTIPAINNPDNKKVVIKGWSAFKEFARYLRKTKSASTPFEI